jgi:hypothetical protein
VEAVMEVKEVMVVEEVMVVDTVAPRPLLDTTEEVVARGLEAMDMAVAKTQVEVELGVMDLAGPIAVVTQGVAKIEVGVGDTIRSKARITEVNMDPGLVVPKDMDRRVLRTRGNMIREVARKVPREGVIMVKAEVVNRTMDRKERSLEVVMANETSSDVSRSCFPRRSLTKCTVPGTFTQCE